MSAIPEIDDAIIVAICAQMRLPYNAFGGSGDERHAVFKERGSIDVCACPGSGKTTLLVAKLGAIMSKWDALGRGVCVISHTNVARNEIGRKLGATSAGNKLLSYPHFVGTIHAFVNEFLAIPWIQANGYTISAIDTEIALDKRWNRLPYKTKFFLDKKFLTAWHIQASSPEPEISGMPFKSDTDTYRAMQASLKKSFDEGIFTHDEMFMWANDFLDKRPEIAEVIRARFPCVFIDEAQDTTSEQSILLHRLFSAGDSNIIVQRFGDSNQAIYGGDADNQDIPSEFSFPQDAIKRSLPKSLRFDQKIADLADPLGLDPYRMEGHRVSTIRTLTSEPQHTVFLFDNEHGARRVPEAFAQLLSATFSAEDLGTGLFKAVGQVHRDSKTDNFPRSIGNYWESYDPSSSKSDAPPRTMLEYLLHGRAKALESGNSFAAIDGLANGLLRLLVLMDFEVPILAAGRRNRHRKLLEILSDHPDALEAYCDLVQLAGHDRLPLTQESWEGQLTPRIRSAVEIHTGPISDNPAAEKFLFWTDLSAISLIMPRSSSAGNISVFEANGLSIPVQFGSIHSVKGETHTATLVLETFYYDHNMAALSKWFTGENVGRANATARNINRLKLHYVAMTRPSHLVCLGLYAPSILRTSKKDRAGLIVALEARGWNVVQIKG